MESSASKYLFFDHGGVLDGSLTDQIPEPNDLLLFKVDERLFQILKDGVQIVKVLHILISKYGYKIGFHSKCKEAEQLHMLTALNDACLKKRLDFPKVSAMAVKDSDIFQRIQPHSPAIIKDRRHGIWIAGYDIELDGKACIRLALSKLLGINEISRRHHVIFDDGEKVIDCAKMEGWTAFLINENLSLLGALKKLVQKEEEVARQREVIVSSILNRSQPQPQPQQQPQPQSRCRWQEDIVRRDSEFKNTNKPRLGGSSLSSGIFTDRNGKEWIGKSNTADERMSEADACKERIAANIYAYYGANTPRIEISRQRFTNTDLEEESTLYAIHVMSELLPNFKTYQQAVGNNFVGKRPNPSQQVRCINGRTLTERGLGHILAVASLINDVDVIGASGGNIGFQEEVDENGYLHAKTVKIDPGEGFYEDLSFQGYRSIRFAFPEANKGESQLAFADLPPGTQQEFLMTLHEIARTPEATFRGFFVCRGAHTFILYYQRSIESLTNLLLTRQKQLLREYKEDLERTELLYKTWVEKSQMKLSPEDQARNQETNAIQEQLFFYIPSDVDKDNQRVALSAAIQPILQERGSTRVLLLKGPAGAGKSLSLLHLEQLLLQKRRQNPNEPMPIYIDLKRFNTQTVQQSFTFVLKEKYHLNPEDIRRDKIILLMDGYDEIAGGCKMNLYQYQRLDQWPKLKMIISCRSQYLISGYRDWFTPSSNGENFEEYELLPFTQEQIDKYIKQYVEAGQRDYTLQEYQHHIKNIPNLASLITNPFILRILVESLPELIRHAQNGNQVNRYSVYEAFMRSWFIKQERRLSQSSGLPDNWDAIRAFEDFSKNLALTLHINQQVEAEAQGSFWEPFFSSTSPEAIRVRSGCPLQRVRNNCYSFLHKSFLEYFSAKALMEGTLKNISSIETSHIIQEPSVIEFFDDMLELNPQIRKDLLKLVMSSRASRNLRKCAANAITLLNAVQHSFIGMDLCKIQIPGAILDDGFFYGVDFTEANLQGVSFRRCWLNNANFKSADMSGVLFGERPYLSFPSPVWTCCYSNDGKWLAAGAGSEIFLYDSETLNQVQTFKYDDTITRALTLFVWKITSNKDNGNITSLHFSPDGQLLVSGSKDNTIRLWEVNTGKEMQCLKGHSEIVSSVIFSPNGQLLASGSGDNTVRLWDVNTGKEKQCLTGHSKAVSSISFSPNGQLLASGGLDSTIRLWEVTTGKEKQCLTGHSGSVWGVSFSPNGQLLASCGDYNSLRLWEVNTGQEKQCLIGHSNEQCLIGYSNAIYSVSFSPNGQLLASCGHDKTIRLWEVNTGKEKQCLKGHSGGLYRVSFSPNGQLLASCSWDGTIRLWEVNTSQDKSYIRGHSEAVSSVSFSPNGQLLASGSRDKTIRLWEVNTGKEKQCLKGYSQNVSCVSFSPNGQLLASSSWGETIRLWDVNTGKEKQCLNGHYIISSISFSPNGQLLASGSWDNTVRLWEVNTGKEMQCLKGHSEAVKSVRFSPNGQLLASCGGDKTVRLWEVNTGKEKQCLKGHSKDVSSVSFSPNDQLLASSSWDETVRLWDVNTGKEKQCLVGHLGYVSCVSFSPNGQLLVSGSWEGIRIWEVSTGKPLFITPMQFRDLSAIDWSRNNEDLVAACGQTIVCFKLEKSNYFYLRLIRSIGQFGNLVVNGVNLEDAQGLSTEQITLIQQRQVLL